MNFQDAQKEIHELLPDADLISFKYEKNVYPRHKTEVACGATVVWSGVNNAVGFYSSTWEGVIKKIKIHLVPNDPATDEGEPKEEEG